MVRLAHRWGRGTRSALGPFAVRTDAKQRGCAPDFDRRAPQGSCKPGKPGTTCFQRRSGPLYPTERRQLPVCAAVVQPDAGAFPPVYDTKRLRRQSNSENGASR